MKTDTTKALIATAILILFIVATYLIILNLPI